MPLKKLGVSLILVTKVSISPVGVGKALCRATSLGFNPCHSPAATPVAALTRHTFAASSAQIPGTITERDWSSPVPVHFFDDLAVCQPFCPHKLPSQKMQQVPDPSVCVGWYTACCVFQSCESCTKCVLLMFFHQGVVHSFWDFMFSSACLCSFPRLSSSSFLGVRERRGGGGGSFLNGKVRLPRHSRKFPDPRMPVSCLKKLFLTVFPVVFQPPRFCLFGNPLPDCFAATIDCACPAGALRLCAVVLPMVPA